MVLTQAECKDPSTSCSLIDWLYQSFTAHQHQKVHTLPKQVSPLDDDDDDDDDITESTRKKMLWFYSLRTALSKNSTVWGPLVQSLMNYCRADIKKGQHVWHFGFLVPLTFNAFVFSDHFARKVEEHSHYGLLHSFNDLFPGSLGYLPRCSTPARPRWRIGEWPLAKGHPATLAGRAP